MKRVAFHREAGLELEETVTYYDEQSPGLGRDFHITVKEAIASISEQPTRYAFLGGPPFRAVRLKRFPYLVIYGLRPDVVWVVAVAHERRHPDYWKHRQPEDL